eukprot:8244471-Pyramimonas_sp.AAC.1
MCLFQIGSTEEIGMQMLDFSPTPHAGCWVDTEPSARIAHVETDIADAIARPTSTSRLPGITAKLSRWAIAVAAHPTNAELAVGTIGGALHGVGPRHMGSL